jgi:hypothetical protein
MYYFRDKYELHFRCTNSGRKGYRKSGEKCFTSFHNLLVYLRDKWATKQARNLKINNIMEIKNKNLEIIR